MPRQQIVVRRVLPNATLARLVRCHRLCGRLLSRGVVQTSSGAVGKALGCKASQIRKDLSMLGTLGTRGTGYRVKDLERSLARLFGRDHEWNVVLIGAGNLGRALLAYGGFEDHGFRIVAVFDADPEKVGQEINGMIVQDVSRIPVEVPLLNTEIAILAVPSHGVQWTAVGLQEAGVGAFLNFSGVPIQLGGGAVVSNIDAAAELEKLRYFLMLKDTHLTQGAGDVG